MGIKSIYKRNQYGQRLILFENDGSNAINVLQGLRQSLPQLRDEIEADPDLDAQEKQDAVAEVNAVIGELVAAVKSFAGSL